MDGKKIFIYILLAIVVGMAGFIIGMNFEKEESTTKKKKNFDIIEISYSYGGGYGTQVTTALKTISINADGMLKFSNSYDDYVKKYDFDEDDYKELCDYINERSDLFDEKVRSQDAMDGGSSYIEITLKDGTIKKFGGYMVTNKKFKEIKNKILKYIDEDDLDDYINHIGKGNKKSTDW